MIRKYLQKIFKKISYGLFVKIHGPIKNSIGKYDDKRIKVTCYKHGPWYPIAENFRKGHGCKDCGNVESGKKRHLNTIDTILDFKDEL